MRMTGLEEHNEQKRRKKRSQQELVYNYIKDMGGLVTTNQLRDYAHLLPMADATKRARELFAQHRLERRWITESEKLERSLKADVMIYYIPKESEVKL